MCDYIKESTDEVAYSYMLFRTLLKDSKIIFS
jgi:hypothetical protein